MEKWTKFLPINFIGIIPNSVSIALLTGWFQAELLQLINKFLDDYEIAYKSAKMTAHCKKWQKMVVAQNMLAL